MVVCCSVMYGYIKQLLYSRLVTTLPVRICACTIATDILITSSSQIISCCHTAYPQGGVYQVEIQGALIISNQ